ncbi:MAG: protease complex subunit PrcB family protein [Hungatella sp.]|nr:protease complex subunit PrcB family protein [Hungatella sp.]
MNQKPRKKLSCLLMAGIMLALLFISGCKISKDDGKKVRDLEFTVVGEVDIPAELKQIITGKLSQPFKLTFSDEQNLYIVVGYGSQSTGGYSIAVKELYLTDNSIVIDTELLGPEKGENPAPETSCPFIVVKTENLENPVIFQ